MVTVWRIRSNYHGVIRRVPYTTEAQGAVCCRVVCRLLHSGALLRRTGKIGAVLASLVQLLERHFRKKCRTLVKSYHLKYHIMVVGSLYYNRTDTDHAFRFIIT